MYFLNYSTDQIFNMDYNDKIIFTFLNNTKPSFHSKHNFIHNKYK